MIFAIHYESLAQHTGFLRNFGSHGVREKRDPGFMAWTSVNSNMDVLRGHLKEKLFVEVARRDGAALGNLGK